MADGLGSDAVGVVAAGLEAVVGAFHEGVETERSVGSKTPHPRTVRSSTAPVRTICRRFRDPDTYPTSEKSWLYKPSRHHGITERIPRVMAKPSRMANPPPRIPQNIIAFEFSPPTTY